MYWKINSSEELLLKFILSISYTYTICFYSCLQLELSVCVWVWGCPAIGYHISEESLFFLVHQTSAASIFFLMMWVALFTMGLLTSLVSWGSCVGIPAVELMGALRWPEDDSLHHYGVCIKWHRFFLRRRWEGDGLGSQESDN